jgi:hypothetical protein
VAGESSHQAALELVLLKSGGRISDSRHRERHPCTANASKVRERGSGRKLLGLCAVVASCEGKWHSTWRKLGEEGVECGSTTISVPKSGENVLDIARQGKSIEDHDWGTLSSRAESPHNGLLQVPADLAAILICSTSLSGYFLPYHNDPAWSSVLRRT